MSEFRTNPITGTLWVALTFCVLVVSTFGSVASASSSVAAWDVAMPSARSHDIGSISSLLLARTGPDSRILVKAKQIIRDLSSSTTCSHAPTVRLLRQCKDIKPKHEDPQSDHQLSNAESVYAISMALCEASQARVLAPPACKIFENMLERPMSDSSIEIVRASEIEACSAVLYGTPGWTSYSTYKSNSKFLCESSRTDYQREELLQTLRDATNVIPEILEALNDHRIEAQITMVQLRDTAAQVSFAQQEILLHAQERERNQSAQVQQVVRYVEEIQETMGQALTENTKVLDLSTDKANAINHKLTELYASFVEAASGITFDLNEQIILLTKQTTSMLEQIHELGTQDRLDQLQTTMQTVSQTAADLANLQVVQIAKGQEVLEAFHNFSPEQLLPKWLKEFSSTIVDLSMLLRTEGPLVVIFAAPTFCLFVFGRFRLAFCIFASYFFVRCLWAYALLGMEVLSYIVDRLSAIFRHVHSREGFTFPPQGPIQSTGICLSGAFAICFCTSAILRRVTTAPTKPTAVVKAFERRSKGNVKENFERSRRACSVPLDCECA